MLTKPALLRLLLSVCVYVFVCACARAHVYVQAPSLYKGVHKGDVNPYFIDPLKFTV